ncbi:MAG: universal stress protein [Maribacter sp.]
MKHIILPTDFSSNALNACTYALRLFENERCTFHVLNCYSPLASHHNEYEVGSGLGARDVHGMHSEKGLERFIAKLKSAAHRPWHFFKSKASPRVLTNELRDVIQETKAELIIMGTKGASGLQEIFMGSTTVQVIKSIHSCPVLAIPENFDFKAPLEIAFATDLYRFYSKSELQPVINLAKAFNSTIQIVTVQEEGIALSDTQKFNLRAIQKHLGDIPSYLVFTTLNDSISRTLELFVEELGIYLLALLNYPQEYLEKLSREPVVKKIAFHTRIPLLVIPEITMGISSRSVNDRALTSA